MTHSFLLSLNEAEFKAFLKEALTEILREVKHKADGSERYQRSTTIVRSKG